MKWNLDQLHSLYHSNALELVYRAASVHRQHFELGEVQMSHLVSIKTGGCPEDCHYCPQSARYNSGVKRQGLMDISEVRERAESAKKRGASRVCLGAAWREVKDNQQFDQVLGMVREIKSLGLETCCTLGMITEEQAQKLADAGLYAYNHNLDTSREHYEKIIGTRTYDDRLKTLKNVRKANLSVCCGGIIGMGESVEDRLKLLLTLSELDPPPESVPINSLVPVPGTPLGEQPVVSFWEHLRMIATARIVLPTSMIRLSAGRERLSHAEQSLCFLAGANSVFLGDKLLTTKNNSPESDEELFATANIRPMPAYRELP